jgi:Flp pilus assembly protein TadG
MLKFKFFFLILFSVNMISNDVSRSKKKNETGATLLLFMLSLIPLLSAGALAIDTIRVYSSVLEQEANAEHAATIAIRELVYQRDALRTLPDLAYQRAIAKAEFVAGLNSYLGSKSPDRQVDPGGLRSDENGSIEFVRWNGSTINQATSIYHVNAVRVILRSSETNPILGTFTSVLGIRSVSTSRQATVFMDGSRAWRGLNPYTVLGDKNGT